MRAEDPGVAQDLDAGNWSQNANPEILNASTRPHVTVHATGNGPQNGFTDFYKFAVTQSMIDTALNHVVVATFDVVQRRGSSSTTPRAA